MISPHLLFIDAGCALQSRRGSLCIRDVRSGSETLYPARVHGIRTIVLAGYGSNVTSEAAHGVVRLGATVAREIAGLALKVVPITEAAKSVRRVIGWL